MKGNNNNNNKNDNKTDIKETKSQKNLINPQKKYESFELGTSKFRKSFEKYLDKKEIIQQINHIKNSIRFPTLVVSYGAYEMYNWKSIFSQMVQTSIVKLFSDDNNNQNIIKEISHINFRQLQHLHLQNNQISNIEALCFIKFQKITLIFFYGNKITNIKCLIKCFHKRSIQTIRLAMNPIVQMNRRQANKKIGYNRKEEVQVILELYSDSNVMIQDLSGYFFPFFAKQCKEVYIKSKFRIHQPKILKMIKKMSPKVQIFQFYRNDRQQL